MCAAEIVGIARMLDKALDVLRRSCEGRLDWLFLRCVHERLRERGAAGAMPTKLVSTSFIAANEDEFDNGGVGYVF